VTFDIYQLEEALELTRDDLAGISKDVQADLDRFQNEKIQDLKEMLIAYAKAHIRYCQQVQKDLISGTH
jgi:sorting nexin-4